MSFSSSQPPSLVALEGRRHPQVRADLLLHNLESLASDMAMNNVRFSSSTYPHPPTPPSTVVPNVMSAEQENSHHDAARQPLPLPPPPPSVTGGRPSTGQLRNHVMDVQHRINDAVSTHFSTIGGHQYGGSGGTVDYSNTLTIASSLRSPRVVHRGNLIPEQQQQRYSVPPSTTAVAGGDGTPLVCPSMYSSLVQTARREKTASNNLFDHQQASSSQLYRLPGLATPPPGSTPMHINHFMTPTATLPPFAKATSLSTTAVQQPLSARVQRAMLDGHTSSTSLRELVLVAERHKSSPRKVTTTTSSGNGSTTVPPMSTERSALSAEWQRVTESSSLVPRPPSKVTPTAVAAESMSAFLASASSAYSTSSTKKNQKQRQQQQLTPRGVPVTISSSSSTASQQRQPKRDKPSEESLLQSLAAIQEGLQVSTMVPMLDLRSVNAALGKGTTATKGDTFTTTMTTTPRRKVARHQM